MRIAVFTDTYYPEVNGVVVSIDNSTRVLSERHKVLIFAPRYNSFRDSEQGNRRVVRFFSVKCPTYDTFRIALPNIVKCDKLIKRFRPDVIHVHTPSGMGIAGLICAKHNNVPVIATYHTLASEVVTYFSPYRLMRIDALIDSVRRSRLKRKLDKIMLRGIFERFGEEEKIKVSGETFPKQVVWKAMVMFHNNFDLVTAPSAAIVKELRAHGLMARAIPLSNGLDLCRFSPKRSYRSSVPRILHVGRLGYEKNIDVVLRAMKLVLRKWPKATLTVVGHGPASDSLKRLSEELGMSRNVNFTGFIENGKLPGIYRGHDFFVTASTFETQGLVIIEAMASGLPVVGVNKYAIPDIVRHGENGFIAEPGDYKAMARFIVKLIESECARKAMGRAAYATSREHDLKQVVGNLEELYAKIGAICSQNT